MHASKQASGFHPHHHAIQTLNTMRRLRLANGALWLLLVIYTVYGFSSQPYNENSRGKLHSSAPVASPETRQRGPQDVSFVPNGSSKGSRRKRPSTPLVDSALLRFLSKQKEKQVITQDTTVTQMTETNELLQQKQWLGQYNRHLVAQSLLQLQGVSQAMALQAGDAVQRHALARTARRRLRLFLRKRDKLWDTNDNMLQEDDTMQSSVTYDLDQVIELLLKRGLTGTDICTILSHTPSVALMKPCGKSENTLESTVTRAFTQVLSESLKLRKYDARKVLRNCPGLLTVRGSKNAHHVVTMLASLGVSKTSLARDKTALPVLLSRSPAALFRLIAFLSSDAVRMNVQTIGPLLRRADCAPLLNAVAPIPRLQQDADQALVNVDDVDETAVQFWGRSSQERREKINDTYRRMSATAWMLRHEIGTEDLGKAIAAYPSVLLLDAETQILPTASYLMNDLGIWQDDLARVLQLYPVLLGMDVQDMKRVVNYLLSLDVAEENLASIFRAFPSLFTLDIENDMMPVIQFLRDIGISNVGRFITRLPPVLGYSVEDELIPKWKYLCTVCTEGSFELSAFPAYFSYPLDKRIKTRYEYLKQVKGIPTQLLSLDKVLRYGDRDFATRVARDTDDGAVFLEYVKNGVERKRTPATNKNNRTRGDHRTSADRRI